MNPLTAWLIPIFFLFVVAIWFIGWVSTGPPPLSEGNSNPGNRFTGDDLPKPIYCPVCGRPITRYWSWTTVDGKYRYGKRVCYGRLPVSVVRLALSMSITEPLRAHYVYSLPTESVRHERASYDRETGTPTP